jgi:hypothetical protein
MTKLSKKNQKRLAKLVALTLMCTGGLCSLPSVASAEEVTVTNVTDVTVLMPSYEVTSDPAGGMTNPPGARFKTEWYPTSANILNITGEFTADSIMFYGGYNEGASGKTVNITGTGTDIAVGTIAGGSANENYSVTGNHVNFLGGTTTVSLIYGGDGVNGANVSKNHVNIAEGSTIKYKGYGVAICGGREAAGSGGGVDANTVTISGTLATAVPSASLGVTVAGGVARMGDGKNVTGNMVEIKGATFDTGANDNVAIYGGYNSATNGNATGNTVTISGNSTFGNGNTSIYGGQSDYGAANDNTVEISGGTINGYIYGGMGSTEASGNTVTISGDAIINALDSAYIYGGTGAPIAKNNTINILTQISVKGLYGGIDSGAGDGNTLNIAAKNVVVGSDGIGGFQNMNFYLPSDIANNDTMLTVNGSQKTDVKGVTFGVAALSGVKLEKGNTVNLITNPSGLNTDDTLKTTDSATLAKAKFLSANSLTTDDAYELSISKKDANTIIATVDNVTEQKADEGESGQKAVSIPDVLKSPVETRAGVVTMINAGADLLISQGMSNAADAAAAERTEGDAAAAPRAGGFAPFAAVSFGKLRAESGSHVDNKGIGMNLGFAREIENKNGKLLVGPVIEYGHGSYDSYQDSGIKADGKSRYWGIGVIAKQTNDNGFYYEGSLRAGRTKSDYNSDLRPGLHVNYDSSATYWALHLGAGKLVDIGHSNTLDYYGKYFYSHTGSDSAFLNGANETANFDAVNSHRIRLGARLTHALNEKNKIYGGLAWQYEFKGDARATYSVSGEAPSPSVKGSSGMIELGWQVKPGKSPMTIDLGVTGWVGKQRGITANVQANWTF